MFSFLYSEHKKMRHHAANWLDVADRVYKFRRDQLTDSQTSRLLNAVSEVKLRLKEQADASRLKLALESLEGVLRDTGGRIYPASSIVENIEFFLVAAIVILGLRAFFVQPFKIPTNSMWPSYYGMTSQVFAAGEEPGPLGKLGRLATLGATNYTVTSPADGEVLMPVFSDLRPAYSEKPGRSMFIFPATMREYTFSVGGQPIRFTVPADWAQSGYDEVVEKSFFKGQGSNLYVALNNAALKAKPLEQSTMLVQQGARSGEARVYWIPVGRTVKRGDKIISFDILTGDLLFVDRFSYNFVSPGIGSGFVFKTGNIEGLKEEEGDKYFIKRLVGQPGDVLEIKEPVLYRNGQPIEGAAAFGKNARKEGLYPGYTNTGLLSTADIVSVPPHKYFALGDNSPRSKDSRYWGFVPEKDVVGRPLFIYYPLTPRWGPAR
jgi:signal peptidase I